METAIKKHPFLSQLYWLLFLALLFSIVFSFRAVTSICLSLILLIALFELLFFKPRRTQRSAGSGLGLPLRSSREIKFILAIVVCYLFVQLITGLLNNTLDLAHFQLRSGLLAIPLALYLSNFINKESGPMLLAAFTFLLSLAGLYCIGIATIDYFNTSDSVHFFYHELVRPVSGHAVYFSNYVFIALVFLMESVRLRRMIMPRFLYIIFTFFLILFLILLSSRLVLAVFCIYLLYFIYSLFRNNKRRKQFAILLFLLAIVNIALLFSTENPVRQRFSDLEGSLDAVRNEQNAPDQYLNGFQFRLLQWKLVPQILDEKNNWLTGVGPANAQQELNRKYIERNMYQGDGKKDRGYLVYNTHNQFLQELLQAGVAGLIAFVFLLIAHLRFAWQQRSIALLFVSVVILLYCFLESLLETQYGTVIFSFFSLLIYLAHPSTGSGRAASQRGEQRTAVNP